MIDSLKSNSFRGKSKQERLSSKLTIGTLVICGMLATSCAPTIDHRGHRFTADEIEQVQPGMNRQQVELAFGSPATRSTIGGGAYYYISSTEKTVSFMKPQIVDRRVVAVYFDDTGTVQNVANYGLKDGKVFNYISRETPSYANDDGLIKQLFRNIGSKPNLGGQ